MNLFELVTILITVSALFSYINYRLIKLPVTIGLMLISLTFSLMLILMDSLGFGFFTNSAVLIMQGIDFNKTLMQGMLCFLLFAGALHVDLDDLSSQKGIISILATFGVIFSTVIIGVTFWYILKFIGIHIPFIYALLFGSLISPTDPIAVMGILRKAGAPKSLETKITGESLFNDGVGVVVFLTLLGIASGETQFDAFNALGVFFKEAVGGTILGLAAGFGAYYLLKTVNNYQVEIMITLSLVMGSYAVASFFHVSGPIAVVVAGLLIGNHGRKFAMSESTRNHLDPFWELIDEILNAVLFVMIGLEILILTYTRDFFIAGIFAIPLVLFARFLTVGIPVTFMKKFRPFSNRAVMILTWGGLRGGISVALAMSLPDGEFRDVILSVTYMVVIFSISVQGLTVGHLIEK
ncbi:MAG: sodium:proton antiporter [Spirochaetia bacterium]|nr:sodium:proton antiporter [Spirochaetia bacterium]